MRGSETGSGAAKEGEECGSWYDDGMRPASGAYQQTDPQQLVREVTAFRDELRAMNIGNDSDRLSQGLRIASGVDAAFDGPDAFRAFLTQCDRTYLQVAQVLSELEDFRQIACGFQGRFDLIAPKLLKCIHGALDVGNEAAAASLARNTAFELSMASFLRLRGLEIILEDERDGDADVVCLVNGVQVRIACKRCYSRDNIPNAIKKANRQLRKGLQPGGMGVIAVCLSRPLYAMFQGVPTIANPFSVSRELARLLVEIFREHRGAYKKIRDDGVIGIFFRLAGPLVFQGPTDPPNLTYGQFWLAVKWRALKPEQDEVLSSFQRLFNLAIPFAAIAEPSRAGGDAFGEASR